MQVETYTIRGRPVRRWTCCGLEWQLMLTRWRAGDWTWAPQCGRCGAHPTKEPHATITRYPAR